MSFAKLICCWGAVSNGSRIYLGNIFFSLFVVTLCCLLFSFFYFFFSFVLLRETDNVYAEIGEQIGEEVIHYRRLVFCMFV